MFVKRGTEKLLISVNEFLRKIVGGKRLKLINDRKHNGNESRKFKCLKSTCLQMLFSHRF